jgi:hypothetical protein
VCSALVPRSRARAATAVIGGCELRDGLRRWWQNRRVR